MRIISTALRLYSLLLALALSWIYVQNQLQWTLFIRLNSEKFLLDLLIGLSAAAFIIGLSIFSSKNFFWAQLLEDEFSKVLVPLQIWEIALIALLSGLVEETFFRGALQPALGLIPTSLLFGLAHFVPRKVFLPWSAYATFAGFLLGSVTELRKNLFPVILAHCAINFVLILVLNRRRTMQPA
jgi:membrane protease YdiL (CAAX protease family)